MAAADLLEDLELFDDWVERYQYIIDIGKKLPPLPPADHNDDNKVRGCMSQVWLTHRLDGERLVFAGDSDAAIVKGLIAVLFEVYSGQTPADILAFDLPAFFEQVGLQEHLSPNRRNGFFSMVERIRGAAAEHRVA